MRVLVTRPMADAVPFAKLLQAAGRQVHIEPMVRIRPVTVPEADIDAALAGCGGLLFTSANGVRAFAGRSPRRDLRAWCVGRGSAEAAGQAGFGDIETAGGDVGELAAHVAGRATPGAGPLVHSAGSHRAGDLSALLGRRGFDVRRLVLYEAIARPALTARTMRALTAGEIDVVTLFSPRTARLFSDLAEKAGIAPALGKVTALSLSPAVSAALAVPVGRRLVAGDRHQSAMLDALKHLA